MKPRMHSSFLVLALAGVLSFALPQIGEAAKPGQRLPTGTIPKLRGAGPVFGTGWVDPAVDTATGKRLVVRQTSPRAIFDWDEFNIAAGSQVHFAQPSATAEALNRIFDSDPTIIQGLLTSTGRVYLVNQNGILFDRGSQVDVRGLIASSLAIPVSAFEAGIGTSPVNFALTADWDAHAAPRGIDVVLMNEDGTPVLDLEGQPWRNQVQNYGSIRARSPRVDPVTGKTLYDEPGGLIMLIAPRVENRGVITANNGQVILAAGAKAYLRQYDSGNASDVSMRGMVVKIEAGNAALNISGTVVNAGKITTHRGNTTLAGLAVNQEGVIRAGGAVNQNGSIWLMAGQSLTLGAGSVTETPIANLKPKDEAEIAAITERGDALLIDDGQTMVEEQDYSPYRSKILLGGQTVHIKGSVVNPGGLVQIGGSQVSEAPLVTPRRVLLDTGSLVSVAGTVSDVAYEKNFATFQVSSNDQRDTPFQKGGYLYRKQVTVDLRKGNPALFDISGLRDGVKRTVAEKTAVGGDLIVTADELVSQAGSVIDISGGAYRYGGGVNATSKVFAGGRMYDIASAPANLRYDAIIEVYDTVTARQLQEWNSGPRRLVAIRDQGMQVFEVRPDSKWLSEAKLEATPMRRLFSRDAAFVEGKSAGLLKLDVQRAVLNGSLRSSVMIGAYQRDSSLAGALPGLGRVELGLDNTASGVPMKLEDVRFVAEATPLTGFGIDSVLPAERQNLVEVATGWLASEPDVTTAEAHTVNRVGSLTVNAGGTASVAADATVELAAGGALTVKANHIKVEGDIRVAGGSVKLSGIADRSPGIELSSVSLGAGATVSTAGLWINDFLAPGAGQTGPRAKTSGGNVSMTGVSVDLAAGSVVDVSGGGRYSDARKLSYGDAGTLTLGTDQNPNDATDQSNRLNVAGTLLGWSGAKAGELTLRSTRMVLGNDGARPISGDAAQVRVATSRFADWGFGRYSFEGRYGLEVEANTVAAALPNYFYLSPAVASHLPTGNSLTAAAERREIAVTRQSAKQRQQSGITLVSSNSVTGEGVKIGAGARIETAPEGSITVNSNTKLDIEGSLVAHAGTVNLNLSTDVVTRFGGETLRIGRGALIDVSGVALVTTDGKGVRSGSVLRGGTINLTAFRNDLALEEGAVLDVGGAVAELDLPVLAGGKAAKAATIVDGEAGSVFAQVTEDAWFGGELRGRSGLGRAQGSFALETRFNGANGVAGDDPRLIDKVDPTTIPPTNHIIDHRVELTQGTPERPVFEDGVRRAAISADALHDGGFANLRFAAQDTIAFADGLDLRAERRIVLDAPQFDVASGAVTVAAPWLDFRNTPSGRFPSAQSSGGDNTRREAPIVAGTGSFTATGDLIELAGHMTVNGASSLTLQSSGEIRARGFAFQKFDVGNDTESNLKKEATAALTGSLTTLADTTLKARMITAASGVDFEFRVAGKRSSEAAVKPGGKLRIEQAAGPVTAPLSAGGSLSFRADIIEQAGTVWAPLGKLSFKAGSTLSFAPGSLTSVSADGLTVPFGGTVNGTNWYYGPSDRTALPPTKEVVLEAPAVAVQAKATIDVSGGGEIQGVEFVPGTGGSLDTLLAANTYAILPDDRNAAPRDSRMETLLGAGFDADRSLYESIQIGPGGPLPAGTYRLLPGYYALLPGAYVVRPAAGGAAVAPGSGATLADGTRIVAGRKASNFGGATESRWSAYQMMTGAQALRESEYRIVDSRHLQTRAAADDRPPVTTPADAGRVAFVPTRTLVFDGLLKGTPANGGRVAEVDIVAEKISVVATATAGGPPAGVFEVKSDLLSNFDASLLLGGRRQDTADGQTVQPIAREVVVNNVDSEGKVVPLTGREVLIAASEHIDIKKDSAIAAAGEVPATPASIELLAPTDAAGVNRSAFLRLSGGGAPDIVRKGSLDTTRGKLTIAEGATVAGRSVALDATGPMNVAGKVTASASLAIGAPTIALDGTAAVADRYTIVPPTPDELTARSGLAGLRELTLRGYDGIRVAGGTNLDLSNLDRLRLDAPGLAGAGSGDAASVKARSVAISNTSGRALATGAVGTRDLTIAAVKNDSTAETAGRIELGAGKKVLTGFSKVTLAAEGDILSTAKAGRQVAGTKEELPTLEVNSALKLESQRILVAAGAAQNIKAASGTGANTTWYQLDTVAVAGTQTGAAPAGGRLVFEAGRIVHGGNIDLPSGIVEMKAQGSGAEGGISLGATARISTAGFAKDFAGDTVAAPAGRIELNALHGDVATAAGSLLDVSGPGDGGRIEVSAGEGTVNLLGGLAGAATGEGSVLRVDGQTIENLDTLLNTAGDGRFAREIDVRQRSGDVSVAEATKMRTGRFVLTADGGKLDFSGQADASGQSGGSIELNAGGDLTLASTARLTARGEATDTAFEADFGHGGDVALNSRNGSLSFASNAEIDVSAAAAGKSDGGEIVFSAGSAGTGVNATLAGKVKLAGGATGRSGRATVEVVQRIANPASTAAMIGDVDSHVTDVAARAAGIRDGLALTGVAKDDVRIRAAAEVETTGNLTIDQLWDLTTDTRRPNGVAGRLTLRSAGDLTVSNGLGLPADVEYRVVEVDKNGNPVLDENGNVKFKSQDTVALSDRVKGDVLPNGETWDIELVGGADTASANRLATTPDVGDVKLSGANAKVRTGTGSIRVAAGRDFVIDNAAAALYTAGEAAVLDGVRNRYTERGGDIRITAGRDIVGTQVQPFVTSWLRRTTNKDARQQIVENYPVGWWSERARFGHVGSFGGGDVAVEAGGSIGNLTVVAPTSGQPSGTAVARGLTVRGGGDIRVEAEGSIDGGDYLVGRGTGRIVAGDAFGSQSRPTLFLLGESGTDGGFPAAFDVVARNDARLLAAANPTMLLLTGPNLANASSTNAVVDGFQTARANFYTYAPASSISLVSVAGNVSFGDKPVDSANPTARSGIPTSAATFADLPPQLTAVAFQGSLAGPTTVSGSGELLSPVNLFPSVAQQLRLYAQEDVTRMAIASSDRSPETLPSWRSPFGARDSSQLSQIMTNRFPNFGRLVTGNNVGPYRYRFVAVEGDLAEMNVVLSDAALFSAGHDLRNLALKLQNQRADQLTLLQAGRDFRYGAKLLNGEPVIPGKAYVKMGGPGRLAIQAGRNIDFGNSAGVDANGNNSNTSMLVTDSAKLSLLAGLKADQSGAVPDFAALDAFFAKLKAINKSDKSIGEKIAETGALEAAAFDGMTVGEGRIDMAFSQVQSLSNGAVDVIAPRGDVRVGLPVQLFESGKVREDLGIVALGGDVRAYLDGDFAVNQSKVVAMLGGEIMVYSRHGDIDAGRGSRDSRSTSPPRLEEVLDANNKPTGVKRFVPPTDAGGSGIRTITFDPDGSGPLQEPKAGGIYLFAPRGTVDAGEAGVSAAGEIFIAALQVLNASNISSGGGASGVPTTQSGTMAGLASSASGTAAGSSKSGDDAARSSAAAARAAARGAFRPSFVTVEVVGFGEPGEEAKNGR